MKSNYVPIALMLSLNALTAIAAPELVACDLMNATEAESVLGEKLKQHNPNRNVQVYEGDKISSCVFFANRSSLTVQLVQAPNAAMAQKKFSEATKSTADITFTLAADMGEKAYWWNIQKEAYGVTVLKGDRTLMITTRWGDGSPGDVKSRLAGFAKAGARKL